MKYGLTNVSSSLRGALSAVRATSWLLFIVLPFVAILGLVLVATAPLDGSARSNLGSSLLTGVVVGVTLIGFESILDRRRARREERAKEELRNSILEAGRNGLSFLVRAHMETIFMILNKRGQSGLHVRAQPANWTGDADTRALQRALMWSIEIMRDDAEWWKSEKSLAQADAIYFVASDLIERYQIEIGEGDLQSLFEALTRALDRLNGTAQRLSESGDTKDAANLDVLSDSLQFHDTPSYVPQLSSWGNEYYDEILTTGGLLDRLRKEFSWLTAELRESKIKVDRDGNPLEKNTQASETYRWGVLFSPNETAAEAWEQRFAKGSWFRRVMNTASSQLPKLLGVDYEIENPQQ